MSTVPGTVIMLLDRENGETTVTYESVPPGMMQNITLATADIDPQIGCGSAVEVTYDHPRNPSIALAKEQHD